MILTLNKIILRWQSQVTFPVYEGAIKMPVLHKNLSVHICQDNLSQELHGAMSGQLSGY